MKTIIILIIIVTGGYCSEWAPRIEKETLNYGSWSNILYSVAVEESTLRPYACNTNTMAHGLMQVRKPARDQYFKTYGIYYTAEETYDYKINIKVAYGYLVWLYDTWDGDLYMTLASYHRGRSKVLKNGVKSHRYVKNILSRVNQTDTLITPTPQQLRQKLLPLLAHVD